MIIAFGSLGVTFQSSGTTFWFLVTTFWFWVTTFWLLVTTFWSLIRAFWSLATAIWSLLMASTWSLAIWSKLVTNCVPGCEAEQVRCTSVGSPVGLHCSWTHPISKPNYWISCRTADSAWQPEWLSRVGACVVLLAVTEKWLWLQAAFYPPESGWSAELAHCLTYISYFAGWLVCDFVNGDPCLSGLY